MEPGTTYQCYVGSVGWEARGWDTAFYPEGLPTEWRLGYYNQFYSCVYLSYAGWSNAGDETLGGWVDDTLERFRFLLQGNPAGFTARERRKLDILAPRLGLVLDPGRGRIPAGGGHLLWLEGLRDPKVLAHTLAPLRQTDEPVYLLSRSADLELMETAKTLLEVMG